MRHAESSGGIDLFLQMLNDFEDPLQQLSLLDLVIEEFEFENDNNNENNNNNNSDDDDDANTIANNKDDFAIQWLSSPEMMSPVLQFLKDPLLCDAALRYIGLVSSMKPDEVDIVFDRIKSLEGRVPTRDVERLPIASVSIVASSGGVSRSIEHHSPR